MSLREALEEHDNDYSAWEEPYRRQSGGGELAASVRPTRDRILESTPITLSVIIPCWNARATLPFCLRALERSSFNRRWPDRLRALIVDDGSTDGTLQELAQSRFDLDLVVLRQPHLGRAHAMNLGLRHAGGDVVISCDADMVLGVSALEELAKRHAIVGRAVLVGFRSHYLADPALLLERPLPEPQILRGDNRICFDTPGWPDNFLAASERFKTLGRARRIWVTQGRTPQDDCWNLPRMVYGALFSVRRELLEAIGGYSERFVGWGYEDTAVATAAIATGAKVIPVPAASGHHIAHPIRSATQWEEGARNEARLVAMLEEEYAGDLAAERGSERIEVPRASTAHAAHVNALAHALRGAEEEPGLRERAFETAALGRGAEAVEHYAAAVTAGARLEAEEIGAYAECLAELGRLDEATQVVEQGLARRGDHPRLVRERMWISLRTGDISGAAALLARSSRRMMLDPAIRYLHAHSAEAHEARAEEYRRMGWEELAWRDSAAAALLRR